MATAVKLADFTSSLFQQLDAFSPARQGHESKGLQIIRSECHVKRMPVSCKIMVDAGDRLGKTLPRANKLRFFKQSALPVDRASMDSEADVEESEIEEPWLGAVIFKRSAVQTHYEFQTSLEKLGLSVLSSDASRSLALSMGTISKTPASGEEQFTPVGISIDVTREGRDLRLEGLVRTAISLCCNRCLSPVVERVFADFSVLLTEGTVKEPTQQRIGVVLGENTYQSPDDNGEKLDIDLDDKLHFPRDSREMDLSKYIRDTVHLEIPSKSLCSAQCSGLCLSCGVNLNKKRCNCVDVEIKPSWGPLEQLKRQLEEENQEDGSEDSLAGPE